MTVAVCSKDAEFTQVYTTSQQNEMIGPYDTLLEMKNSSPKGKAIYYPITPLKLGVPPHDWKKH